MEFRNSIAEIEHPIVREALKMMEIEVPSFSDTLLTIYECEAFQHFTYWSQHLYIFNSFTLATLARQAELKLEAIRDFQHYPLSNHLYWLSRGKPGGQKIWSFFGVTTT